MDLGFLAGLQHIRGQTVIRWGFSQALLALLNPDARTLMLLQEEQARLEELHLYQVTQPKRGIIGKSRFAQRLRNDIRTAARDPRRCVLLLCNVEVLCVGHASSASLQEALGRCRRTIARTRTWQTACTPV